MQPYQNYYAGQMPMFNQQPMQANNPYMERLMQMQQQIVPTQMQGTNQQFVPMGKIVESIDIVKTMDIPMDGNMYYFPTADGSSIFGKRWLANGQTQILTFKPIFDNEPNNSNLNENKFDFGAINEFLIGIQNDIKTLNDKVDKISKPSRAKKEVADDE